MPHGEGWHAFARDSVALSLSLSCGGLDGSPAAFYLRRTKSTKWFLFLEGALGVHVQILALKLCERAAKMGIFSSAGWAYGVIGNWPASRVQEPIQIASIAASLLAFLVVVRVRRSLAEPTCCFFSMSLPKSPLSFERNIRARRPALERRGDE